MLGRPRRGVRASAGGGGSSGGSSRFDGASSYSLAFSSSSGKEVKKRWRSELAEDSLFPSPSSSPSSCTPSSSSLSSSGADGGGPAESRDDDTLLSLTTSTSGSSARVSSAVVEGEGGADAAGGASERVNAVGGASTSDFSGETDSSSTKEQPTDGTAKEGEIASCVSSFSSSSSSSSSSSASSFPASATETDGTTASVSPCKPSTSGSNLHGGGSGKSAGGARRIYLEEDSPLDEAAAVLLQLTDEELRLLQQDDDEEENAGQKGAEGVAANKQQQGQGKVSGGDSREDREEGTTATDEQQQLLAPKKKKRRRFAWMDSDDESITASSSSDDEEEEDTAEGGKKRKSGEDDNQKSLRCTDNSTSVAAKPTPRNSLVTLAGCPHASGVVRKDDSSSSMSTPRDVGAAVAAGDSTSASSESCSSPYALSCDNAGAPFGRSAGESTSPTDMLQHQVSEKGGYSNTHPQVDEEGSQEREAEDNTVPEVVSPAVFATDLQSLGLQPFPGLTEREELCECIQKSLCCVYLANLPFDASLSDIKTWAESKSRGRFRVRHIEAAPSAPGSAAPGSPYGNSNSNYTGGGGSSSGGPAAGGGTGGGGGQSWRMQTPRQQQQQHPCLSSGPPFSPPPPLGPPHLWYHQHQHPYHGGRGQQQHGVLGGAGSHMWGQGYNSNGNSHSSSCSGGRSAIGDGGPISNRGFITGGTGGGVAGAASTAAPAAAAVASEHQGRVYMELNSYGAAREAVRLLGLQPLMGRPVKVTLAFNLRGRYCVLQTVTHLKFLRQHVLQQMIGGVPPWAGSRGKHSLGNKVAAAGAAGTMAPRLDGGCNWAA